ncbi:FHA domain-containing protein At4g14490-like [Primulina huaijiensis]|uniref:FHA domain-containing protein At4g14490-like n=1 Tax=Primulina huaijiensis TaxID=1492673 RepID=UPI003CC6E04F
MAPCRPAAAQQEDRCSILKLIMEKGPLSGQTVTFKPETSVRIGRIVRGNNVSIKDPGISSKHLVIQLETSSDSGCRRWTVMDLGSSNGTVLNDTQVQPSEPAVLSDGDVVKIGETTMIMVKFENNGGESEGDDGNGRRNVRRGRKNQGVELEVIDEVSVLGLEGNVSGSRYNLRGKRAKGKVGILGSESLNLGDDCGAKIVGRRTRGSKAKVLVNGDYENEEEMENMGRLSSKNNKNSSKKENLDDLGTDTHMSDCEVVELEGKGGRITNVRTRNSKKTDNVLNDLKGIESVGMRVSTRRTRSSRMEESLGEIVVDSVVNDGKRTQKGTKGKRNLTVKATALEVETMKEPKWEHEICEENKGGLETRVDELVEESIKSGAGFASMSGVKECDVSSGKTVVDLENMTLGEWFDFLEVHLPKQIIDATEEMISAMEQNVRKLNEFMLQKKNDK